MAFTPSKADQAALEQFLETVLDARQTARIEIRV